MKQTELISRVDALAGPLRASTFRASAEWMLQYRPKIIMETGCYRGTTGDGQSTAILALLAQEICAEMHSYDVSTDSIARASELLRDLGLPLPKFFHADSVAALSNYDSGPIGFAYLDSFDHDPRNPGPCQRHQLAEVGAVLGKLASPCAILMDDHIPEKTGGKTRLAAAFLEDRGWHKSAEGYQVLYTRK